MKEDIDARLQRLRNAVEEARSVPMSASVMINRAEFLDLLSALEGTIDQTLSTATEVVGDREAVLADGMTQAEQIIRDAQLERDQLVSDTDVFKLAVSRATDITDAAELAAEELQRETDQYVEEKLANLELTLENTVDVIRKGRARTVGDVANGLGEDSEAAEVPRAETEQYVEEKLASFEATLERAVDVIRKGRARLSGGHVHGLGDDSDVAGMHLPDHLER